MSDIDTTTHALSGGAASVLAMALLYPLENVRCRLQVQMNRSECELENASGSRRLEGVVDALYVVAREEGISGLFKGMNSALTGVFIGNTVYFYFYEHLKNRITSSNGVLSPGKNLCIAALAGIANALITNPIWVIQTRLAVSAKAKYSNLMAALVHIFKTEGLAGLYSGVAPSLILVSNPAIQFVVYDQLVLLMTRSKKRQLSDFTYFLLGAIAKAAATFATYPYQLVKSRMQVFTTPKASNLKKPKYANVLDALVKIYANEGFTGLYSGIWAKLWQTVLNAAFLFLFYEKILRFIQNIRRKK